MASKFTISTRNFRVSILDRKFFIFESGPIDEKIFEIQFQSDIIPFSTSSVHVRILESIKDIQHCLDKKRRRLLMKRNFKDLLTKILRVNSLILSFRTIQSSEQIQQVTQIIGYVTYYMLVRHTQGFYCEKTCDILYVTSVTKFSGSRITLNLKIGVLNST